MEFSPNKVVNIFCPFLKCGWSTSSNICILKLQCSIFWPVKKLAHRNNFVIKNHNLACAAFRGKAVLLLTFAATLFWRVKVCIFTLQIYSACVQRRRFFEICDPRSKLRQFKYHFFLPSRGCCFLVFWLYLEGLVLIRSRLFVLEKVLKAGKRLTVVGIVSVAGKRSFRCGK